MRRRAKTSCIIAIGSRQCASGWVDSTGTCKADRACVGALRVVEKALGELPYVDRRVRTPIDLEADGKALDVSSVVGVSIARSGGPLEKGLRRVVHDARLGSMLIHNDEGSQEPLLYDCTLPASLKTKESASKSWVMVLDSQMGTGAAALSTYSFSSILIAAI